MFIMHFSWPNHRKNVAQLGTKTDDTDIENNKDIDKDPAGTDKEGRDGTSQPDSGDPLWYLWRSDKYIKF